MKTALFLITFLFMAGTLSADVNRSLNNMKKRLPQVIALKKAQALGEDNKGFLIALKNVNNAGAIAAAENADRRVVYASVAKKHGISIAQVGKQRAIQIHQKAARGTMLQDGSGRWRAK